MDKVPNILMLLNLWSHLLENHLFCEQKLKYINQFTIKGTLLYSVFWVDSDKHSLFEENNSWVTRGCTHVIFPLVIGVYTNSKRGTHVNFIECKTLTFKNPYKRYKCSLLLKKTSKFSYKKFVANILKENP